MEANLHEYDLVIINSSAGKDSLCAMYRIYEMCMEQSYPSNRVWVSHQDLGESEWSGVKDLASVQAKHFGFMFTVSRRVDKNGSEETFLQYAVRRGKWPSGKQRWCTSDFKRGPGAKVVTMLSSDFVKKHSFLHVFGFRADESPSRKKKEVLSLNKRLSTLRRTVHDYLPIHSWNISRVWSTIKSNKLPYHEAYDYGMPRLSCVFCIYSPFDALVLAGIKNPELLDEYVEVEDLINHRFQMGVSLKEVKKAIAEGYTPIKVQDWLM